MKETSKKFIEDKLKVIIESPYKILKRNPGHITLCEVSVISGSIPEMEKRASKFCDEKIVFKLKDEKEARWEAYCEWEKKELKKISRRRKRKAKKKRKRILKTIYRGFAPNPTSVRTLDPGWVFKKQ